MVASTPAPGLSPYLAAFPAVLALVIYAIVNGVPFVYPDTFVYDAYGDAVWQKVEDAVFRQLPADDAPDAAASAGAVADGSAASGIGDVGGAAGWTPTAGRSLYYAALAAMPGPFAAPWNGILLQAYCCALTVAFAWRAEVGAIGWGYLAAMIGGGVATTFGIFASTVMPDVWAAVAILAFALLVARRDRLGRVDAAALWGFVLFAAVSHSSHLALIAAMTALCAAAPMLRLSWIRPRRWRTIGVAVAVLVAAVGLNAVSRVAVERAAGTAERRLPFLTAHLVDGGPGMAFIRDACPGAGFAVCDRADRLPVEWRAFLFGVAARPEDFARRVGAEDAAFAVATLRHDPVAVAALALGDAARQLVMVGLTTTPIRAAISESRVAETTVDPLGPRVTGGRLYDAGWIYRAISASNATLALAGLSVLALALAGRPDGVGGAGARDDARGLASVALAGLVSNAIICGVLASPYDRFQARVVWLIPVLAVVAAVAAARRRTGAATAPTPFRRDAHDHH